MRYQGRSPINDVVRSVVIGAAMLSPLALEACSGSTPTPPQPPPQPPPGGSAGAAGDDAGAPATEIVRPRAPDGHPNPMPTRGFSGAAPRRGSRPT